MLRGCGRGGVRGRSVGAFGAWVLFLLRVEVVESGREDGGAAENGVEIEEGVGGDPEDTERRESEESAPASPPCRR